MSAQPDNVIDLSKAAFAYGPFLFAIIFIVAVPPYAHSIWKKAFDAPADPERVKLLKDSRLYFRSSWMFGIFLVLCSVLWWSYAQFLDRTEHAYTGYITGLTADDILLSVNPDDHEYLVPANIDGTVQYRFVYVSQRRIVETVYLYVSYINKNSPLVPGRGALALPIKFKLVPGQSSYKFVNDPTMGAMVVPIDLPPKRWTGLSCF